MILNKDTDSSCSHTNNNQVICEDINSFTNNLIIISAKLINFDINLKKSKGYSSNVSQEINFRNKRN